MQNRETQKYKLGEMRSVLKVCTCNYKIIKRSQYELYRLFFLFQDIPVITC